MKNTKMIALITFIFMLVAVFSFALPFATMQSLFVTHSSTGFELIQEYDANGFSICLGATIFEAIVILICCACNCKLTIPMITSLAAAVLAVVCFSDGMMPYAGTGFWMFVISHVISAALCIYSLTNTPNTSNESN